MLKKFASYYKPHKKLFVLDMLAALLVAVCNLVYPMITRAFINKYVPEGNVRMIFVAAAVLLFIYILKASLNYFIQYWGHVMGVRIQSDMRQDAFRHLQRLPFTYFDQARSGKIMSRIVNDTMDISELAHHGPEDLFISVITLVGAFILLCTINIPLTLIIFACLPFLVLFASKKRTKLAETSMESRREVAEINANLENSIAGVRVSKAYDSSNHELDKFERGNHAFAMARSRQYKAMAEFSSGTGFIIDMLTLITLLLGGLFAYRGVIGIGDFTAYLLFVGSFTDPIKRLISFVEQLQSGMTGFERLQELMAQEPEAEDPNARELTDVTGDILFNNISFSYDDGTQVFRNMTLPIKPGETVALVGPSGGGKSTLCHLLPRFYELDQGEILLDGVNIDQYTRLSLREHIGIVQQDTFLFSGTIRDNIAYGNFTATDEEVVRAAKLANIHDFIMTLEDGYDSYVGERGTMLSGGQKQRVSIARIFLKNPPILILDEATSALDNTTELAIQSALDSLSDGRTTMVVAHRLSTIRNADNIVYIADNAILEQGTHEELLKKDGYYAELWNAQNKNVISVSA